MIRIATKVVVKGVSPSQIYNWIVIDFNLEKFRKWHPGHVTGKRPATIKEGDTIWFVETMNGFKVDYEWEIIELRKDEWISMKAKFFYPILNRVSFHPFHKDTQVVHELRVGLAFKGLEKVSDCFIGKLVLTPRRIEAIKQHAIEEFKNLEDIL